MQLNYCKHMVISIDKDGYVKSKLCNEVANQQGWCKKHREAQQILDIGKPAGYPAININESEELGEGFEEWEEYAIYSLCQVPITKNHKQVIAPTGLEKLTPHLNKLIVKNRAVECQQRVSSQKDVALNIPASKPARIESDGDLGAIASEWGDLSGFIKKPAPATPVPAPVAAAPGKVAVLDREPDIDIDPDEVFDF